MDNKRDYRLEFQTPPDVCRYMVSLIPEEAKTILEPTKGIGNIVKELKGYEVTAPDDYFLLDKKERFDCVIMNPPFSSKSAFLENAPKTIDMKGMKFGYYVLLECMQKSNDIIALMPWFTLSDSDIRLRYLNSFGLKSVTALPRKTFEYARVQTCVIHLQKGFKGDTSFRVYDHLPKIPSTLQLTQSFISFNQLQ